MDKSPDAFRTISEVADWLGVPTHVLRFWESRFTQVKPVKRAGGRRYYRPVDMMLLGGIKRLLHDEGLTIRGVQKMLREEGVRHVSSFSQPLDALEPMRDVTDYDVAYETPMAVDVEPEPADNVVPLVPAAAEPPQVAASAPEEAAMPPLILRDEVPEDAPAAEEVTAEEIPADPPEEPVEVAAAEEEAPESAVAEEDLAPDVPAEDMSPEEVFAEDPAPEAAAVAEAPAEEEEPAHAEPGAALAADEEPEPVVAGDQEPEPVAETVAAEDDQPIPVFSFLRRRSHNGAPLSFQPDLFGTPAPEPAPDAEPTAAAAGPVIPETPGVPDTDAEDDDPAIPSRPGVAARLAIGRLRADPPAIARLAADLRDLRARL